MSALRRHFTAGSWVALVAVLTLVLLPTLSLALAQGLGDGRSWGEICTPQGVQRVVGERTDRVPPPHAALEHCPLCSLAADAGAVLPPTEFTVPALAGRPAPRCLPGAVPRTPARWARARPRGPPSAT